MRGEWIAHITVYILSIAGYIFTKTLPSPPNVSGGDVNSYFFPTVIIIVILILNTISLITSIRKNNKLVKQEGVASPIINKSSMKIMILIIVMLGYVVILPIVGYVISTAILLVLMMLMYSVRSYKLLTLIPVGVVGVLFYVFKNLLKIPLP